MYSYLKLLAARHGGFVFASVDDIMRHTKKWSKGREPFSERQGKRILRMFRELHILGKYETRIIHGRKYRGWQFAHHEWWAESHGDFCDFKAWDEYESNHSYLQGNCRKNGTDYDTENGTDYDPETIENDTQNDPARSVVFSLN
ncbi:MAG: hypothetical protein ACRD4X_14690 [Candidatus Acidiferrales bacterium]